MQLLWTESVEQIRDTGRLVLKLITTGNQFSPDMIQPDHFPDWGPNRQKVEGNLKTLRKAIPVRTLQTTDTAREMSLKTSVEMYTIWEMTGMLNALETMDKSPWIGKARDRNHAVRIMPDIQTTAHVCGADPFKIALERQASPCEEVIQKKKLGGALADLILSCDKVLSFERPIDKPGRVGHD